jgi:aspartyl-tRNA(Asn)/glutamyl-tRNA(Gln) amidotransferase subunit C
VLRIAALARLEIPEERLESMRADLSEVLDFVAALRRLDLAGYEPTTFAPAETPLRADQLDTRKLTVESALAAAPARQGSFFLVPPIVENLDP